MNTSLKLRATRWTLSRLLAKPCTSPVPRSGDEGRKIDCFVVYLKQDGKHGFLLHSFDGEWANVRKWDGESFSTESKLPLSEVAAGTLDIIHFYGLDNIEFTGVGDYVSNGISGWIYLRVRVRRLSRALAQSFFNRRSLDSRHRLEILELLVSLRKAHGESGLSSFDVMSEVHSMKWAYHPAGQSARKEIEYQLDSLVESGDAQKSGSKYHATGKALITLESAEEQDRRYRAMSWLQWTLVFLTFILALSAIVQTGLISLPVLLDLSKE
jgi:hypothetical protein